MRRAAILTLLLLAACKPSFDDRYDKADKDIRAQASGVDSELAKQQRPTPSPTAEPAAASSDTGDPPAE
ncbi:MAG TPA: hypothetical protein VF418_10585 [Sphingomonadaceae bacterium]